MLRLIANLRKLKISSEHRSLLLVLTLTSLTAVISVFIIYLLRIQLILLAVGVLSPIVSIIFLLNLFQKHRRPSKYHSKGELAFIQFMVTTVLVMTATLISVFYSFEIYFKILSLGMVIVWMNIFFYLPLAIYERYFRKKTEPKLLKPLVTVIVPAYNEGSDLEETLYSLIETDYPNKEIIVVDDGSTDKTYSIASNFRNKFSVSSNNITVIRREKNMGKSLALNCALSFARGDIIVIVDGDSTVEKNALTQITNAFGDPSIAAVAGNIKIWNRTDTFTKCLALEVLLNVNLIRPSFSSIGLVTMVPGSFGAFRKSAMKDRGLFDQNTLTEDFDLTVKILKGGGRVIGSRATCYSKTPSTLKAFYKQRTRWMRGNFQTLLKHRNVLRTGRYGMVRKFAYPFTLIPFIVMPIIDLVVAALSVYSILKGFFEPVIFAFAIFTSLQFLIGAIAFAIDSKEKDWKLLFYSPLFVIGYRHILDLITLESIFDVLLRKKLTWTSTTQVRSTDTTSNIICRAIAKSLGLIDKIISKRAEIILTIKSRKSTPIFAIFCFLFSAGLATIFLTVISFDTQQQTPYLSFTKRFFRDTNNLIYDKTFASEMVKLGNIIPKNESLVVSHHAPEIGYFTRHPYTYATEFNDLNSKDSLLKFMIRANITYLVAPKGSYLNDLSDFKDLASFPTDTLDIHLYKLVLKKGAEGKNKSSS